MREIISPSGALFAEFATAEQLLQAVDRLHLKGYRAIETFSPFSIPGLSERVGGGRSWLPVLVFGGGVSGALGAYLVQWFVNVHSYPLNIGGRPAHAVPAFLLPTFEGAVLVAACTAFVGVLLTLRMPRPWHPVFEIDGFERASTDRYWVAIDLADPRSDPELSVRELTALHPIRVVRLEGIS